MEAASIRARATEEVCSMSVPAENLAIKNRNRHANCSRISADALLAEEADAPVSFPRPLQEASSLAWDCSFFCGKTRIWEGGRPWQFSHLDTCDKCGSRVAATASDKASIKALIDKHLL